MCLILDESSEDEEGSGEEEAENGEELMEEELPSVKSKLVEGVDGVYQGTVLNTFRLFTFKCQYEILLQS